MQNVDKEHRVKALVVERNLRAIEWGDRNMRLRPKQDVDTLDIDIGPTLGDQTADQTVATPDVEHAGTAGEDFVNCLSTSTRRSVDEVTVDAVDETCGGLRSRTSEGSIDFPRGSGAVGRSLIRNIVHDLLSCADKNVSRLFETRFGRPLSRGSPRLQVTPTIGDKELSGFF